MLDWIFEGIVTWISSVMTSLMDAVSGLFLDALGTDMVVMEEYFPFVTKAFGILQYTAWALLFLITAWQLFRAFGGPITDAENPLTLVARSILFAVMIGYYRYEPVTLTVISSAEIVDFNGDDPVYSYETETRTYYTPVVELSSEEDIMVPAYREVTVYLPIYNNGSITSYSTATYFEAAGEEMISPTIEMIP